MFDECISRGMSLRRTYADTTRYLGPGGYYYTSLELAKREGPFPPLPPLSEDASHCGECGGEFPKYGGGPCAGCGCW